MNYITHLHFFVYLYQPVHWYLTRILMFLSEQRAPFTRFPPCLHPEFSTTWYDGVWSTRPKTKSAQYQLGPKPTRPTFWTNSAHTRYQLGPFFLLSSLFFFFLFFSFLFFSFLFFSFLFFSFLFFSFLFFSFLSFLFFSFSFLFFSFLFFFLEALIGSYVSRTIFFLSLFVKVKFLMMQERYIADIKVLKFTEPGYAWKIWAKRRSSVLFFL